jgi:hypothetical protein
VELTVWPSYALGGGKGTKAAAANLAKDQVSWYSNTFKGWTGSGGNGAAMRIQPHVWAARDLDDLSTYLPDVIRNSICTHGSPIGILGAVLHSLAVAHAVARGELPTPEEVLAQVQAAEAIPDMMRKDPEVGEIWIGLWEREAGRPFEEVWADAVIQAREAVGVAMEWALADEPNYHSMLERLGLFRPTTRGSGVLTAVAAMGLLWQEPRVGEAMKAAARAVGSDTDTIATMAGAIAGAFTSDVPDVELLDQEMLIREASRFAFLAIGEGRHGHQYPDLLHWSSPRTQADVLMEGSEGLEVIGLGHASPTESDPIPGPQKEFLWQWVTLDFGQSLLVKRRRDLQTIPRSDATVRKTGRAGGDPRSGGESNMTLLEHNENKTPVSDRHPHDRNGERQQSSVSPNPKPLDRGVELGVVLDWLSDGRIVDDSSLGYVVRRVARDGTPDQLAILMGTLRERLRR